MTSQDRRRLSSVVGALAEAYRQTITPATIAAYEMALDDLAIEAIEGAARSAMRSCKFMPTAAELRERSGACTAEALSALAWESLCEALRRVGYYQSVRFEDAVLTAAVRNLGGWMRVCDMAQTDEFDRFVRPRFEKIYQGFAASGVAAPDSEHLVGFCEQTNGIAYAQFNPPPVFIAAPYRPPVAALPAPKVERVGKQEAIPRVELKRP